MFSHFDRTPERDGQMDGRTDRIAISIRASVCWRATKIEKITYVISLYCWLQQSYSVFQVLPLLYRSKEFFIKFSVLIQTTQVTCNGLNTTNRSRVSCAHNRAYVDGISSNPVTLKSGLRVIKVKYHSWKISYLNTKPFLRNCSFRCGTFLAASRRISDKGSWMHRGLVRMTVYFWSGFVVTLLCFKLIH